MASLLLTGKLKYSLLIAFASAALTTRAVDTATGIFDERFRSLQVDVGSFGFPAIINLNSDDRLTISFDELSTDRSYLRYNVVHCNADWQPSQLVESEYIDGFNEGIIDEYDYSRLSYTPYVHYTLVLPNRDFNFKVSGNYLLRIYSEDDPETTLLQQRLMVSEATASVSGDISVATDIDYRGRHQQLQISVDTEKSRVEDPFNDLTVTISQNGRTDNQSTLHHPLRVDGKTAVYDHQPGLIFAAGNNYRRFETVSTTAPTQGVERMSFAEPYYRAELVVDYPRSDEAYTYDLNLHGNYLVRERDSQESEVDADYVVTRFRLEAPPMRGSTVYIDGDMVNRRLDDGSRMSYNQEEGCYEKYLLLKQGAYSYQYLTVDNSQSKTEALEGDHYPTRNSYLVAVYHRNRLDRYDRLIGFTMLSL